MIKTIASSHSDKCLLYYLSTINEPLRSVFYVEIGYTSRLCCDETSWETLSNEAQTVFEARTFGFIDGWEAKENE